jgi:hypothetical protein
MKLEDGSPWHSYGERVRFAKPRRDPYRNNESYAGSDDDDVSLLES